MSISDFPPLRIPDAVDLTAHWRNYYASLLNDGSSSNGENIFRGFRIPIDDLQQLLDKAAAYNNAGHADEITDVRAYLAKGPAPESDVHVLLVPVATLRAGPAGQKGTDKLEMDGTSAIYNFTTPCPIQCDIDSQLYKKEQ